MKTVEEFIREIEGSAALLDELKTVSDRDALAALLKKYDVSGTVEDFVKALGVTEEAEGEISDDSAEAAAGGVVFRDLETAIWEGVWRDMHPQHRKSK